MAMPRLVSWSILVCLFAIATADTTTSDGQLVERPFRPTGAGSPYRVQALATEPQTSGYFAVGSRKLFFWFYSARSADGTLLTGTNVPLLVWLNGGPGCSSLFGAFIEIGPYGLQRESNGSVKTVSNPNSWAQSAHLLFVDSPVGTGLSYGTNPGDPGSTSIYNVATTLVSFLDSFYKSRRGMEGWSQLTSAPLFLSGESYAGHYLPALGAAIQLYRPTWPLRGVAMGNPCTNVPATTEAYLSFSQARGLVSAAWVRSQAPLLATCKQQQAACTAFQQASLCAQAADTCNSVLNGVLYAGKWADQAWPSQGGQIYPRSYYDWQQPCIPPNCIGDTELMLEEYVRANQVSWGAPSGIDFTMCSAAPGNLLSADSARSYDMLLPPLLDSGVRVMIYSGQLDFICNTAGNSRMLDRLMWSREKAWAAAKAKRWSVGGRSYGAEKAAGPLSLVTVDKAGHMVPMDQPVAAAYMIREWLAGRRLAK